MGECAHTIRVGSGDARAVVTRVWEDNGGYQFEARVAGVSDVRRRFFRLDGTGLFAFLRENDTQQKLEAIYLR